MGEGCSLSVASHAWLSELCGCGGSCHLAVCETSLLLLSRNTVRALSLLVSRRGLCSTDCTDAGLSKRVRSGRHLCELRV